MAQDLHLEFIKEKIYRLRTAVMYSMSNSIYKLPNNIVTAIKVDNQGQIWFICQAGVPGAEQLEQNFPCRLRFYKKGVDFHVEVSGKATVVDIDYPPAKKGKFDKETPNDQKFFLIKMSMTNVEYTEPHAKRKTKLEALLESGYRWFLRTAAFKPQQASVLAKLHQTNYYGKNTPTYHS